jgi:hypothetical protein
MAIWWFSTSENGVFRPTLRSYSQYQKWCFKDFSVTQLADQGFTLLIRFYTRSQLSRSAVLAVLKDNAHVASMYIGHQGRLCLCCPALVQRQSVIGL